MKPKPPKQPKAARDFAIAREEFITMASHELRTPLTAVRGYLSIIAERHDRSLSREVRRLLKQAVNATDQLSDLVEDLLDVAEIEQHQIVVRREQVDINRLIREVASEYEAQLAGKKLYLKFKPVRLPAIASDKRKLKQILSNLIDNAIKYTLAGGITIKARRAAGGHIEISVKDSGIGITGENLEKIFDKFYRIKTKTTSEIQGTGLGLWISRALAENLGGHLYLESIEGVGSNFTLKLPR